MEFIFNDGGREAAGFKGHAGDCVTRSIAIAMDRPYKDVYEDMAAGNARQRITKHSRKHHGRKTARSGISTRRKWFRDYMTNHGWKWTATMGIGTGCKVHLHDGELPMGRLIVAVSKHYTTVIDGVIHDTHNPQRATIWNDGRISRRCVYGYWSQ